jgi:hypothetical protein
MSRANRTTPNVEVRHLSQVIPNGQSFLRSSSVRCFRNDLNAFQTNLKKNAALVLTIPVHRTNRDVPTIPD